MRIAIVGYGRMGRLIEDIAVNRGHSVVARIDPAAPGANFPEVTEDSLKEAEGAIEFSLPDGVIKNARVYSQANIPVVLGTTGWDRVKQEILSLYKERGTLLYGSNFSIGANLLIALTKRAAQLIEHVEDYDIMLHEYHHRHKKDSPSGTALTIAEVILNNLTRKKTLQPKALEDREILASELHVSSTRGGAIPGTHTITLDSEADSITLTHTARSRGGFALGAVMGLEWIKDKTGVFHVDEFFKEYLSL
jgi:4-hydroxy-tetrahydrodipicolinate reductase